MPPGYLIINASVCLIWSLITVVLLMTRNNGNGLRTRLAFSESMLITILVMAAILTVAGFGAELYELISHRAD